MFDNQKRKGFTLIEAMIVIFIIVVVVLSFYSVFSLGSKHIIESKNRLGAVSLANEKMEIIRNLDYENIGTKKDDGSGSYVYGIPAGEILEEETITKGTREYYVHTLVQYVDDPYDGTEDGTPDDDISNDYKRVRIEVAWNLKEETKEKISLVSTFAPLGIEKASSGGTLFINVINNEGSGVSQASVSIRNSESGIDINTTTDNFGIVSFPGAPQGIENYEISVSKAGFYPVKTYPPYPSSSFYPTDVNASVSESRLNVKSLITDNVSELNLKAVDFFGNTIPSLDFEIKGGKKIGDTDADPSEPVFDFNENTSFNSSGEKKFDSRSLGEYFFKAQESSDYYFSKLDNNQTNPEEIDLAPDVSLEVKAIYADKNVNSLLVKVIKDDESFISGAQVELRKDDINFEANLSSDIYGQVFFPESLPELEEGEYELKVEMTGYQSHTETVSISNFILKEIKLTEQ